MIAAQNSTASWTRCPWRSLPRAQWGWTHPLRPQQRGVALRVPAQAAKKQARSKGGNRRPGKKASRDFEGLSIAWDDVFEALCKDSSKAEQLEQTAAQGYSDHGRGFLFVRCKVASRSKKAAAKAGQDSKGFAAAPPPGPAGTPLPNNPALLELGWSATYIPSDYLSSLGGIFAQGGAPLPDAALLGGAPTGGEGGGAATAASGAGLPQQQQSSNSSGGGGAAAGEGSAGRVVDPPLLNELARALRGMDAGRLAGLVGAALPAPRLQAARQAEGGAAAGAGGEWADQGQQQTDENNEEEEGWVGGERSYEPEAREFVVLLLARVDQQPAIGADIVMAVTEEGPEGACTQLVLPGLEGLEELAPA